MSESSATRQTRATFRPTRHPPMTEGKLFELSMRVEYRLPLWHPQDAKAGDEAQPDSDLPQYLPGEVERLQKLGYDGQWIGGVFFVTRVLEQDRGGEIRLFEERPEHHGRHRTEAEKARAATPEAKAADAERKRRERLAQKGGAA